MAAALFTFEDVTLRGRERPRLDEVSCVLPPDGVTAIAGPSGAGKSSLLRCCNRLEAPDRGVVRYLGEDLEERDVLAHRREVAMVFQQPVLFPGTVADNLHVADPAAPRERMAALLERCALPEAFLSRAADELSGGEAQRACLARALATGPRAVLMDEPTSALDAGATGELERLMRSLADDGVPVVLVTHDDAQRGRVADAEVRLSEGRVVVA